MEIPLLGKGFTHNLTARIAGDAASLYRLQIGTLSLEAVSVSASDVESQEGYTLKVAYSPVEVTPGDGFDLATLTITCPDLETPVSVNLQGRCEAPCAWSRDSAARRGPYRDRIHPALAASGRPAGHIHRHTKGIWHGRPP